MFIPQEIKNMRRASLIGALCFDTMQTMEGSREYRSLNITNKQYPYFSSHKLYSMHHRESHILLFNFQ